MRRGYYHGQNKVPVIRGEDGAFIGFGLGADYAAEHECGIGPIRAAFGFNDDPLVFGIKRRSGVPGAPGIAGLTYFEFSEKKVKQAILAFSRYRFECSDAEKKQRHEHLKNGSELRLNTWFRNEDKAAGKDEEPQVIGAWSESDFGIRVSGDENIANLKKLYEAAIAGDISLFMGGGMAAFDNPGLCVAIASAIPESVRGQWHDADKDNYRLKLAASATDIEAYLSSKGKRWYALSPRWADEAKTVFRFWLNPCEQQKYSAGWFTVEELKQWADDTGPVIIRKAVAG